MKNNGITSFIFDSIWAKSFGQNSFYLCRFLYVLISMALWAGNASTEARFFENTFA